MKKLFVFFFFAFFCLNFSFSQKPISNLEEALSWAPYNHLGFDDWEQIKKDFGFDTASYRKGSWKPKPIDDFGNEVPEEIKKDNFTPYTSNRFQFSSESELWKSLGLAYPDIIWEGISKHLTIVKVNTAFNNDSMRKI
ncbi:MAG: hypothetical protein IAF38_00075, partial [Bacteroidia bacterium]|nr:hypothetical protein [Bacteroidia bacterium]